MFTFNLPDFNTENANIIFNNDYTIDLIYSTLQEANKAKAELVRLKVNRVRGPVKETVKKVKHWYLRIPHPDYNIEEPMNVAEECTPKNAWGPKDTLQKHTFGSAIKQEKTEEELLQKEKRYKKSKNLTSKEIEELIFLHKALPGPYYGPDKQTSIGTIPDLQEDREKSETPWLRLPNNLTNAELIQIWYDRNPEYRR